MVTKLTPSKGKPGAYGMMGRPQMTKPSGSPGIKMAGKPSKVKTVVVRKSGRGR